MSLIGIRASELGVGRRREAARLLPGAAPGLLLAALAAQVLLPLYLPLLGLLDVVLLTVVYVALLRRNVLVGMLFGMAAGLAQDSLTHGPLGLFGIINTIIGYSASSISLFLEADYPGARSVLAAGFFLVHQLLYWMMSAALLGSEIVADVPRTLMLAAVHAGLALLLYQLFDRLKRAR